MHEQGIKVAPARKMSYIPPFSHNYNIEVCDHVRVKDNTFDSKRGELYTQLNQPCLLVSIGNIEEKHFIFMVI